MCHSFYSILTISPPSNINYVSFILQYPDYLPPPPSNINYVSFILQYPDYHDVVAEPMDLLTIRSKIKRGDYSNLDGLVADMELLFSNCQQFHRRHSEIGKAGVALRRYFDKRCSDLGLKDLELVGGATSRTRLRSSGRKK